MTVNSALRLLEGQMKGVISDITRSKIIENFNAAQSIAKGDRLVYSINTGFGSLCTTKISRKEIETIQENLLKSHSVGVGSPIEKEIAKLMLILKVHALCKAFSGISIDVLERICWHIENGYIPFVPEQGSVGASGDLAPLAHLSLPLIGLGHLSKDGDSYIETEKILRENNMKPLVLHAKEGLALINGTQFISAFAV
ncbi:MAG: aromatic amino acid lyase, partial [Promethearchaeota archaeon]